MCFESGVLCFGMGPTDEYDELAASYPVSEEITVLEFGSLLLFIVECLASFDL